MKARFRDSVSDVEQALGLPRRQARDFVATTWLSMGLLALGGVPLAAYGIACAVAGGYWNLPGWVNDVAAFFWLPVGLAVFIAEMGYAKWRAPRR